MEVAWQCEIDEFCCKVLEKHWPGVKRYGDIRKLDPGELEAVDLICGGPPCQPASVAGKRRGDADDRWLWPETLRLVAALRPRWCLFENPSGILSLQGGVPFESVLSELEKQGYEVQAFIIPACAVDAPHRRDRVWIVANSVGRRWREDWESRGVAGISGEWADNAMQTEKPNMDVADTCRAGLPKPEPERQLSGSITECRRWPVESDLGRNFTRLPRELDEHLWPAPFGCEQYDHEPPRIAKGVKDRAARIKALGNAVIPQIVEIIGRSILAAEGVR